MRVKVHDFNHNFNTPLIQEKSSITWYFATEGQAQCVCMCMRVCGGVLLENQLLTSISRAWTGSGYKSLAQVWPPTPARTPETTRAHLQGGSLCTSTGGITLPQTHLSNLFQMCLFGWI